MSTTLWSGFHAEMLGHLQRCPFTVIDAAVREAAREFFRESNVWRVRGLTLLTTVASQADYTYSVPANAELWRVHSAWLDGSEVEVALPGEDDDTDPALTDSIWRIDAVAPATLRLSPLPQTSGQVATGTLGFIPSTDATGIPTVYFDEYHAGIASKAVADLAVQPAKPWTNPSIVTYHKGEYAEAVFRASNKAGPVRRRPLRVKSW